MHRKYFSETRWLSYRVKPDEPESIILSRYLWNIRFCEALYPAFHFLEIALRNNIDEALTNQYGESWLSEESAILGELEVAKLLKTQSKLKTITHGHKIAALQFGFWTNLFKKEYRASLWPHCIQSTFPHMPRKQRDPRLIYQKLNNIRRFQNRVFHHESIWKYTHLSQKHDDIQTMIRWIAPELLEILKPLDRFNKVLEETILQNSFL